MKYFGDWFMREKVGGHGKVPFTESHHTQAPTCRTIEAVFSYPRTRKERFYPTQQASGVKGLESQPNTRRQSTWLINSMSYWLNFMGCKVRWFSKRFKSTMCYSVKASILCFDSGSIWHEKNLMKWIWPVMCWVDEQVCTQNTWPANRSPNTKQTIFCHIVFLSQPSSFWPDAELFKQGREMKITPSFLKQSFCNRKKNALLNWAMYDHSHPFFLSILEIKFFACVGESITRLVWVWKENY